MSQDLLYYSDDEMRSIVAWRRRIDEGCGHDCNGHKLAPKPKTPAVQS